MVYEFQSPEDATDAIRNLIHRADNDCTVEVMMTHGNRCVHPPETVTTEELHATLGTWLQAFPRGLVRYTVESERVISATIWCHCTQPERKRCPIGKTCPGAPDSPKATIILNSVAGYDILVGRRLSPEAISSSASEAI